MTNLRRTVSTFLLLMMCGFAAMAQQDTLRVKVMTYNLRFGELASLDELANHIKSFKPDFVALEEVDVHTDRKRAPHQNGKDFIGELAYKTGMFGLYGKTIDYAGGYYGIGILSKYPYTKVEKVMLPNPENVEPRAILEGTFDMNGDTIIFASTHLDVKTESTRNLQAQMLCDHFANRPYPVILGGDFNARHYSHAITKIMNKSWVNLTNGDLTFPAWKPIIKIDYLYARPVEGWNVVRTQTVQSQLSDHLPIVTELEYVKNKK